MAGIRKKGDAYYCTFRFQGRRFYFTVGKVSESQAFAKAPEVDETLGLLERGRLTLPEGVALEDSLPPAERFRSFPPGRRPLRLANCSTVILPRIPTAPSKQAH